MIHSPRIDYDWRGNYHYPSADGLDDGAPTLWICAMFVALYSITTIVHVVEALRWRRWFLFPTIVVGGIGEIIGWAARTWSAKNRWLNQPYLMQISTTIIAPTFLSAANFIILGQVIKHARAEQYSRLSPKNYSVIFICVDVVALVVQAIGGGMASGTQPVLGGHIMLAGILIQLVAILCYTALGAEFLYRLYNGKPIDKESPTDSESSDKEFSGRKLDWRLQLMLFALAFSSLLLFIRAVYRTAELSVGWEGYIIRRELYFNVLDGGMVVLSMYTINFLHPGWLIPSQPSLAGVGDDSVADKSP